ncbi:C4-dicarboxylate ABC transporter substrate-binding protein [Desulfosarcina alkanivorans]|uniref:C4-dicarboxylate ABC transporter substrate-binding protein n=1 Tax=Desulfosarcina alkanivorans TaxID=571177 RepID=A0A5K7YSZ6_9BACT|nr:TAXI family TRAP transporter solute-binding subunit [Desulfosarcina alkanivorans]BBO71758.1 C4-dicarboxylate ABC transporter substrate-binding protein [Desulfosarcina alkanivorans]
MKKGLVVFCGVLQLIVFLATSSLAVDLGVITGGEKGTYYQFGLNLQELVKEKGIRLKVYNSTGSIENLYAVYKRPRTQMGIVQSDVLAFVSRVQNDPVLKRIAKKTKMIFPLYNEEIHLLGKPDIKDFDDLTEKSVAIGKEGSGTYLTAKLLFEVSDVRPRELIAIGTDEALSQLKNGAIDAMFYVAGYPVKLFKEDVTMDDNLALIPILNKSITEFYPIAEIPDNTYPWQPETINTVAVKAVLVSFNFRRANCQFVGQFAEVVNSNMDWLMKNGHPKWKSVDLDYPLRGWEQYDCVKKYLARTKRSPENSPTEINPILEAVKNILSE